MVGREMTEVAQHIDELEKEQVILSYRPVINWDRAERQRVEAMIEVRSPRSGTLALTPSPSGSIALMR